MDFSLPNTTDVQSAAKTSFLLLKTKIIKSAAESNLARATDASFYYFRNWTCNIREGSLQRHQRNPRRHHRSKTRQNRTLNKLSDGCLWALIWNANLSEKTVKCVFKVASAMIRDLNVTLYRLRESCVVQNLDRTILDTQACMQRTPKYLFFTWDTVQLKKTVYVQAILAQVYWVSVELTARFNVRVSLAKTLEWEGASRCVGKSWFSVHSIWNF